MTKKEKNLIELITAIKILFEEDKTENRDTILTLLNIIKNHYWDELVNADAVVVLIYGLLWDVMHRAA